MVICAGEGYTSPVQLPSYLGVIGRFALPQHKTCYSYQIPSLHTAVTQCLFNKVSNEGPFAVYTILLSFSFPSFSFSLLFCFGLYDLTSPGQPIGVAKWLSRHPSQHSLFLKETSTRLVCDVTQSFPYYYFHTKPSAMYPNVAVRCSAP
jgi:hypothetical protein